LDEGRKFAVNGHNLLVKDQTGTGRAFLLRKIVEYMRYKLNNNVAIMCSTGIAATHYGDLDADTLHKWSGIGGG